MTIIPNIQKELTLEQQNKILTTIFLTKKNKVDLNSENPEIKNLFSMSKSITPGIFYPILMSEKEVKKSMPFLDLNNLKAHSAEIFEDSNYPKYASKILNNYYIVPYLLEEGDMTEENKLLFQKWFVLSDKFANLYLQTVKGVNCLSSFKSTEDETLKTFNMRLKEVRDCLVEFHNIAMEVNKNNILPLFDNKTLSILTAIFWDSLSTGISLKNVWNRDLNLEGFKTSIIKGSKITEEHKRLFEDTQNKENLDLVVINSILLKIIKKQDDFFIFEEFVLSNRDSFLYEKNKRLYKKKSFILAEDLWLKSLKKVFKKNELNLITKKQNEFLSSKTGVQDLDNLKMLEYNDFSVKQEFLLKAYQNSKNPKILAYVENILIQNGVLSQKKEYDYFNNELAITVYRTYINLNWDSLKSRVGYNNLITSNILATYIKAFKITEKEKNKENPDILTWADGKDNEIILIFESTNKENTDNFKDLLMKYMEFSFSKDFLTKEVLHILNLKSYNTNDYVKFVNEYIEKSKVMILKKELEKNLAITEKKEKKGKL